MVSAAAAWFPITMKQVNDDAVLDLECLQSPAVPGITSAQKCFDDVGMTRRRCSE